MHLPNKKKISLLIILICECIVGKYMYIFIENNIVDIVVHKCLMLIPNGGGGGIFYIHPFEYTHLNKCYTSQHA